MTVKKKPDPDAPPKKWRQKLITLSPRALMDAQKLADEWYGGNLSAFIASRIEIATRECRGESHVKIQNFEGDVSVTNSDISQAETQNISPSPKK